MDQMISSLYWERMETRLRFDGRLLTEQEKAIFGNACIDSTLLSLRILDEFFGKPCNDFITAGEFGFRELDILKKQDRIQINNHVSHLTHRRSQEKVLEFSKRLIISTFPSCTEFLEHLVQSFLKPEDAEFRPISQELCAFQSALKSFNI
jgi:hypothetical protein